MRKRTKKPSRLGSVSKRLEQLRSGKLQYADVVQEVRPILYERAVAFCERWKRKQTLLLPDDLVTWMELALERAVDEYDPEASNGNSLLTYVDVQVGRAAERQLREAAGWPEPDRSPVAEQVYTEDLRWTGKNKGSGGHEMQTGEYGVLAKAFQEQQQERGGIPNPEEWVLLCEALDELELMERERLAVLLPRLKGMGPKLVELIVEGHSLRSAALAIYQDKGLRLDFRLDSQQHADRVANVVSAKAREMARELFNT